MARAVFARQSASFSVVGGFFEGSVRVVGLNQTAHVVVSKLSAMAELIDGRALLADGVVFDFGEGTVRKSGLCQSIQLVIFIMCGDVLKLPLRVGAKDGLQTAVAIVVVTELCHPISI